MSEYNALNPNPEAMRELKEYEEERKRQYFERVEIKRQTRDSNIKKFEELLKEHGFKVSILGCGCCDSPEVKVEYNGEVILDDGNVNIDQFGDKLEDYDDE